MAQPHYSRPDDPFIMSSVDQEVEGLSINNPGDKTEAGIEDQSREKKSLLSKVKNKAKDKIHKAKDKLKAKNKKDKESDNGEDEEEGEEENNDDAEVHPKTLLHTPTSGFAADGSFVNHGKPADTFGVSQTRGNAYSRVGDEPLQTEYDGFLRSTKGGSDGDSRDLTSVPTDYSSPQASVDAVMPAPIISPGPASDLGEQSSASLGEIAEKPKEEEKAVATEAPDELSRSSPSFGQFGETTRDKLSLSDEREDLEAIERDSMSQEIGKGSKDTKFVKRPSGGITQQPQEGGQQSPAKNADRELPSDEAGDAALPQREPEKGSQGELPSAEAAIVSRGSEKPSERPLRDPDLEMPVPKLAEFTETMFSSKEVDDLRDTQDSTGRNEPEDSQGHGVPGVSGRDYADAEGNTTPSNLRVYDQEDQVQESINSAGEKEQFLDPQLDESDLQKQTSSSTYPDEHGEGKGTFADVDEKEEEEKKAGGTSVLASVTAAFGSAVGAAGTKAGIYPTDEHTGSDTSTSSDDEETTLDEPESEPEPEPAYQGKSWTQRITQRIGNLPPITPQNSTVEGMDSDSSASPPQSWIKKAVGMLYSPANEKEGTTTTAEEAAAGEVDPKSEKNGAQREAFADASDSFVQ